MTSNTTIRQRLLKGGFWALCGKMLAVGFNFVLFALLARLLSPDEMGAYFLTYSVVTVAALVARMGLDKAVVTTVANRLALGQARHARRIMVRMFALTAIGAAIVGGGLWLGVGNWLARSVFGAPAMAPISGLIAAWVVFQAFETLCAETFRGLQDIGLAVLFERLLSRALIVIICVGLWLAAGQATLQVVVAASVGGVGAGVLLAVWVLLKRSVRLDTGDTLPVSSARILRDTWPFLVSNLAFFIIIHVDLWIVGIFRPEIEVAFYGAAARLALLIGFASQIANAVLPPVIAEYSATGRKGELQEALRATAALVSVPAFALLLVFVILGAPLLELCFGAEYRSGAPFLQILAIGQFINVGVGSCGYTLLMTGHQRLMMGIGVLACCIAALGGLWVISPYGTIGIAWVATVALIVQQLLMLIAARRYCGIWTHASPFLLAKAFREIWGVQNGAED